LPDGGIGEGVLELAVVLAKYEGKVLAVDQPKVGAKKSLESRKGVPKPF
jgi:hypothetical protein